MDTVINREVASLGIALPRQFHLCEGFVYPRQIHKKLFDDQDGKCFYCKEPMFLVRPTEHPFRACTLDHKVARANGGGSCESNLCAACAECNGLKGHLHFVVFIDLMSRAADKRHLAILCNTAMYPNCKLAKRNGLWRKWPTRKESQLDRAWKNILAARNQQAAVAQEVEARL